MVVENLARHLDLGSSLDMVDIHLDLGNSLDMVDILVATLVATLVARHLGNSLDILVVVVPEVGVALEEAAPPLGKSFATGVAEQDTLPPNVKMLWQMC